MPLVSCAELADVGSRLAPLGSVASMGKLRVQGGGDSIFFLVGIRYEAVRTDPICA